MQQDLLDNSQPTAPGIPDGLVSSPIQRVIRGEEPVTSLDNEQLVECLELLNDAYRRGASLVDDAEYDHVYLAELRARDPEHPFLQTVEAEPADIFGARVKHPNPMLSTAKAYTQSEVESFVARLVEASGDADPVIRATAKLDGMAGRDDGTVLATRGDGDFGQDVTRLFDRGLVAVGGRGLGVGEVVVDEGYYQSVLLPKHGVKHPRNFVTGLAGADTLKPVHLEAFEAGAVRFVPYTELPSVEIPASEFLARYEDVLAEVVDVPYRTDGVVIEAVDAELKADLGSTSSHHRWQLAIKGKGETAVSRILDITLQVGRTGRITPVLNIEPVNLEGATISNVTAHTAAHLGKLGLGIGAEIEVIRSGAVIPKIESVVKPVSEVGIKLDSCPCCSSETVIESEYLVCPNTGSCPAQAARSIEHFFRTIGNCDGFGPSAVDKLVAAGITQLVEIYQMDDDALVEAGFGPGQAANLVAEMTRSREVPLKEANFLAGFGIRHLGRGDSRKILEQRDFDSLGSMTESELEAIPGFGSLTSGLIVEQLQARWSEISAVKALGFNLTETPRAASEGPLVGKSVVFTGKMTSGDRDAMKDEARQMGANVQSSVNKKTDYLVCGEKVGASKTNKARDLGVKILTEEEYRSLVSFGETP